MIASGTVPAPLPAHIGVSQTSQFTIQLGLCRHPDGCPAITAPNRIFCAPAFADVHHFSRHSYSAGRRRS